MHSQSAYNAGVATANIKDGAITSSKIGSSAVTSGKLANNAVTTDKINSNAVTAPKIDFSTFTVQTGNTKSCTLTAGTWLVWATANILTAASGSFATDVNWFGQTRNFQGYRVSGQNRNQSEFTFAVRLTLAQQSTYTCTTSKDSADIQQCTWLALKLG